MSELTEDTIGVIQFEFADWRTRPPAHEIMDAIREKTADIPGILVEVTAPRAGPPTGKPIQVQLAALDPEALPAAAKKVAAMLAQRSRHPRPRRRPAAARHRLEDRGRQGGGREIRRRRQHRRHRACSSSPTALKVTEYRPVDSDKAVDILVRFPPDRRSLDQIDELRVQTPGRPRADRQFRDARAGAARRLHQPRQRQPRDDGVGERRRRRADRQGAGGDRARARQDRSRAGRHLQAQGRGRGAREGAAPS